MADLRRIIAKKGGGRQNIDPAGLKGATDEKSTTPWFASAELKEFWHSRPKAYCALTFPVHVFFWFVFCETRGLCEISCEF